MTSSAGMSAYYDEYWSRDRPPPEDDPLSPVRLRLLRRRLREAGAHSVLEIGSGAGDLAAVLSREGQAVVGLEVSERAIEIARGRHPGVHFVAHSVEELPWPLDPAAFDAVVAFEVIEHLLRPRRLLEGAQRALRPGGHLALTTPFHGLAKNLVLAAVGFDRHFAVEGDHIRFFSDRTLRRLLDETGFDLIRLDHLGRVWPFSAGSFVWARRR